MIQFKTDRQRTEWNDISGRLKQMIEMLSIFRYLRYNKEMVITELMRTQEEQDELYGKKADKETREKYNKKPWSSVHQFGRGADVRTHDWERNEVRDALFILNTIVYDVSRPRTKTAIHHDIGTGEHIHIQVM